ncbi:hypothetical protein G7046_g4218 [Stylonectria norvegica]|nr:hypothetical protein G7046_g4218 [Stylonectria norvegica]
MAIFTGRKSVAVNSPRHLTLRHARRSVRQRKLSQLSSSVKEDEDTEPDLNPGEERLNSFWAPGLEAGPKHFIKVTQTIKPPSSSNDKPLRLIAEQNFFVDAPQFSLPEGSVYSTYPPAGYPDDSRILPHVVLSDPHLPWERLGSPRDEEKQDVRNKVPWLALFSFTQDELKLQPGALGSTEFKQSRTLSIKMTVGDLWKIGNIVTPATSDLGEDVKDATGEFIFLKPDLFKSLFSTFDGNGDRQVPATPDTSQYKFLSHVRKINTTGMAVAGVEDVGIFSVVVGNRCGPLHYTAPESVSVHLVSIEGVEKMSFPDSAADYVALCSLHSWNYTVLPPGMLNVPDAFESLGQTLNVLRPPDDLIDHLKGSGKVPARLGIRLEDGYSLMKYRLQTGEQTLALYRGPFTPTIVPQNPQMNQCSNTGQDLQILDQDVGIMDISYSAAWQLGRTLAVGNQSFAAALSRFRTAVHTKAMQDSKIQAVLSAGSLQSFRSRADVLGDLKTTVRRLSQIQTAHTPGNNSGLFRPGPARKRWHRQRLRKSEYPRLGFNAPFVRDDYLPNAIKAALDLSLAKDGTVYNETNDPVSTDWMIILAWVMDRMFLSGVPSHYLIADPSHLGPESLRFFYIDPSWVDALIDGALSLANHMGEDRDRVAIKHAINRYIHYLPQNQPHRPQIPTYGFYLRSDLVTMFPDLKVTTLPAPPDGARPERAPLLLHEIVADGVMLGLFDRVPGSDEFTDLIFTQPPHQQRFAACRGLSPELLEIDIRRQYTVEQADRHRDENRHKVLQPEIRLKPTDKDNWLVWSSSKSSINTQAGDADDKGNQVDDLRILRLPYYADEQRKRLSEGMGTFVNDNGKPQEYFDDDTPNSALLAMQLNDPIYNLTIKLENGNVASTAVLASLHPPKEQQQASELSDSLRNLLLTRPSTFRSFAGTDEDEEEAKPSFHQSSLREHTFSLSDFHRHQSYSPAPHVLKSNLAPHVRTMVTETLGQAMNSPQPHGVPIERLEIPRAVSRSGRLPNLSDPAGPPIFICDVYTPQCSIVMQSEENLPQDLIFSVLVKNNMYSDYKLIEFDIAVPLGPTSDTGSNFLMETYEGPGANLLSNLRFNILRSFTEMPHSGVKCMLLRLIPRSSKGWISIQDVNDMGFLLCLAQVNGYEAARTDLTLYTSAYYMYVHDTIPRTDSFTVSIGKHAHEGSVS